MDFELTSEQELLRDTTRQFLTSTCPIVAVRELADHPDGFVRSWWGDAAALGWTSLLVNDDGTERSEGVADLVIVAEEMGRLVSPGPLVPVNVVAAAVATHGTAAQRERILPGLLSGESVAAWCYAEPEGDWDPAGLGLSARIRGDRYVLSGTKAYVEAAPVADQLLVTARTEAGPTQFLLAADHPGVSVAPVASIDLVRRFGEVRLEGAEVGPEAVLGPVGGALVAVERQLELAVALQCAETVGCISAVFEMTVEWAFDRYSFGRPLASYQALKHRFADMKLWLEACSATATAAANALAGRSEQAGELVSVAKAYIGDHAPEIVQDCVQLHGGIGVTWDHDLHLYLRRVTLDRALFGDPADHRERVAAMLGM